MRALQSTPPFSQALEKWIDLVDEGAGTRHSSGADIAQALLRAYLVANGRPRWNEHAFENLWREAHWYFDPEEENVVYRLVAPVYGVGGITRSLSLDGDLSVRRLPAREVAALANIHARLVRVVIGEVFLWAELFFIRTVRGRKKVAPDFLARDHGQGWANWDAYINEEVALARGLLTPSVVCPTLALVRFGFPQQAITEVAHRLPWIASFRTLFADEVPGHRELQAYRRRRRRFFEMASSRAKEDLAASVRRFAFAWENRLEGDQLADLVSALEALIISRDEAKTEIGYKLRVRTGHLLAGNAMERAQITEDLRRAYAYRSRVAHGEFVFDDVAELQARITGLPSSAARRAASELNEIRRLSRAVAAYYRKTLAYLLDRGSTAIDWKAFGL